MSRPRCITVCREGWYYLLVLGLVFCGAMLREVNLLLILAGLLLGPLLFNLRAVVVTLRNLEVRRGDRHRNASGCANAGTRWL